VLSDLLGVQPEDRHKIVEWSLGFIDFFNIFPITTATTRRMIDSTREMDAYTRALTAAPGRAMTSSAFLLTPGRRPTGCRMTRSSATPS